MEDYKTINCHSDSVMNIIALDDKTVASVGTDYQLII
jgi:hypothetical protein